MIKWSSREEQTIIALSEATNSMLRDWRVSGHFWFGIERDSRGEASAMLGLYVSHTRGNRSLVNPRNQESQMVPAISKLTPKVDQGNVQYNRKASPLRTVSIILQLVGVE